jgi:PAS domain S-box-containing protein
LKGSVSVLRDITERRRVEEALRESEEQFRGFIENLPLGVYRITPPGRVLMANPALLRMLGYDSGQDLAFRNLEGESSRTGASRSALLKQIGRGGEVKGHEAAWKRRDESVVFVRESTRAFQAEDGKVLYYDGAVEDISERKRLEEQLHQAQRMEAVGSLASGVAHDFNNLLTIIIGYSDLLLDGIGADVRMLPYAEGIKTAAERAAALTRQLLAFTRKHAVSPRILDLNPVLTNVDKMLRRMLGDNIELVTHLPPGLGCVKADPGRIEQVIINLAVSARDAMPQGGRLTLEAANVELDSSFGGKYESVRPGHYVMIAVSDTGIGMETETQAHLFQPFSAAQDREIGLGLAAVYGIVRQSEGHLWVYSEPGKGTTFKVYLPRVDQAPEGVVAVGESVDEPALNSETVLLIENDEAMRSLTKGILESRGYGVLEAKGPNEALEVAERHRKPIHLLLTDVVMPQISGVELTKHLTLFHPETKVLYMSGYADKVILHHGVTDPDRAFLQKPFTAEALARKLRQVLGSVEAKKA